MQSPPPSHRRRQGPARGGSACQRCRRRKQKCDLKYPNCSNCESVQAPCLTYDPDKRTELPRNYVSHLESQVDKLTRELQELRTRTLPQSFERQDHDSIHVESPTIRTDNQSPAISSTSSGNSSNTTRIEDLVTSVRSVVAEPSRQPRFLGQSGGITLAKLVMAAIRVDALPCPLFPNTGNFSKGDTPNSIPSTDVTAATSLPPRHAANHLVDVYFQYRTPHLPVISRSQVEDALESAYTASNGNSMSDQVTEKNLFTAYIVLAIALCDLPGPFGNGRPSQSEGCFGSAIQWIEKVITYSKSDIETLRTVLLLTQFVALSPSRGSLWHLTGTAMRLCIDIGLHCETDEQGLDMDPELLNERRRLWYSTYQFDRMLCITLARPFGIADESVRVPLPNPWATSLGVNGTGSSSMDVHSHRAHNHMFELSQLESEIRHVQNSLSLPTTKAYPKPNYSAWIFDIQPRLHQWYATIPELGKSHPSSIFANQAYWDAIYNNAILLLHRPKSSGSLVSNESLTITFDASCKLISSIKILQREGKVEIMWKYVHHLFMAGLGVIYSIWQLKEIRDNNSVASCISILQSCASTLSAMSETFPGASSCRDVFDSLSTATIDWLIAHDANEISQNRIEFEKQVQDLFHQMQPAREGIFAGVESRIDNMSSMLSMDNFAFGDMLSSAAQWPVYDYVGFSDLGDGAYNSMQVPTFV